MEAHVKKPINLSQDFDYLGFLFSFWGQIVVFLKLEMLFANNTAIDLSNRKNVLILGGKNERNNNNNRI